MFDPVENRKILQAAHDKISESLDQIGEKEVSGMYRKSDNAQLDKNTLGPVYVKIL